VRSLIAILPLAFFLAGCQVSVPAEWAQNTPEVKACEVVKQAILEAEHAPAGTAFDKCDSMSSDGESYTVAVAIHIPHVDEHGVSKPDTFYYGDARLDKATGKMRATGLVHN